MTICRPGGHEAKRRMSLYSNLRRALASLSREQRWFIFWVLLCTVPLAWLAVPGPRAAKAAQKLQQAHAAGQAGATMDYAAYWIPRAGKAGLVLAWLFLLGTRALVRPVPLEAAPRLPEPGRRAGLGLITLTGLVMLYSAWANAPRLNYGLWGDEEATMRKSVVGQFHRGDDGKLSPDPISWQETLFRYRDPNNHPLNSVLSRLSHEWLARDLTRPDGFYFDERAMRFPVFIAGLLGLAAMAWVGWVLGRPMAGGMAVLLMASHPWFVRYGVESRGYGFLFLFIPLAIGCLVKAVASGRWRWWVGYGLSQFLIMWSFPGSLHVLLALNASALCMIFGLGGLSRDWRLAQAGRWFSVCALGALLCTILMLPLVQPLMFYLKAARMQGPMPAAWYGEALIWLCSGMPWHAWDPSNPLCWSWQQFFAGHAMPVGMVPALLGAAGVLIAAGIGWWKAGGIARALLPALLLFPGLFFIQMKATGGFGYSWYILPGLPGVILLASGLGCFPWKRSALPAGVVLAGFSYGTAKQNILQRHFPIEQMREGTMLTRTVRLATDPRIDEVMSLDIIMTTRGYDPAVLPLPGDDPDQLKKYLAEADRTKKPFFVHIGSPFFADEARPKVMALVRNPAMFELIATLPGMDAPYTRQVFRYRPNSVAVP